MVLEFLFASTVATGVAFKDEISRASANELPMSTARTGIEKELLEKADEARKKEEYKKAVSLLNRAVKYDPYYPFYYSSLGMCYTQLGNWEEALKNFYKVLALEGKVYVTNEPFIASTKEVISAVENLLSTAPKSSKDKTAKSAKGSGKKKRKSS